ncbi:hypothetical protein D8666_13240 [Ochrobactrum soli]|nr:hypothetical protein D8666_13240 [[Ochrobactrum] soli]
MISFLLLEFVHKPSDTDVLTSMRRVGDLIRPNFNIQLSKNPALSARNPLALRSGTGVKMVYGDKNVNAILSIISVCYSISKIINIRFEVNVINHLRESL